MKKLRLEFGYSQQEVAKQLCISRTAVGKYELGIAYPDIEKLKMLANIYSCSFDYLLGQTDRISNVSPQELQLIDHVLTTFVPDYSTKDLATISEDEFKLLLDKITSSHIAYTLHNRLAKEANNDLA